MHPAQTGGLGVCCAMDIYIDRTIEHASDGISYSGLEHLQPGDGCDRERRKCG